MSSRRIKHVFLLGLAIGLLLLSSTAVLACSCELPKQGETVKQAVKRAHQNSNAVFAGEVVEVITNPKVFYLKVRFKVERSWKNARTEELTIRTGRSIGGDCGYRFEVGEHYLVYAYGSEREMLETNICQRTRKLADAEEDLKLLGKSITPTANPAQQAHNPSLCREAHRFKH